MWLIAQTVIAFIALTGLIAVWWQYSRTPQFGCAIEERPLGRNPDGRLRTEITARILGPSTVHELLPFAFGDAELEVTPQPVPRADATTNPIVFTVLSRQESEYSGYGIAALRFDRWQSLRVAERRSLYGLGESQSWVLYRCLPVRYLWWRLRRKPRDQFQTGRWVTKPPSSYDKGHLPELFA